MIPWLIASAIQGPDGFFSAVNQTYQAIEPTNGQESIGEVTLDDQGSFDWTGDIGGVNETDSWWSPEGGAPAGWYAKLEYTSGTNQYYSTGSDTLGTWEAMSTGPHWRFRKTTSGSSGGSTNGVYTLSFSDDGGSTTYATVTLDVTLTESSL